MKSKRRSYRQVVAVALIMLVRLLLVLTIVGTGALGYRKLFSPQSVPTAFALLVPTGAPGVPHLLAEGSPAPTFARVKQGDAYQSRLGNTLVSLPAKGSPGVTFQDGAITLSFHLVGYGAPQRVDAGENTVTSTLSRELSVRYTMRADRVKEDFILSSRPASRDFRFSLQTTGLTGAQEEDGIYFRTADGKEAYRMLNPTVSDATRRLGKATLTLSDSVLVLSVDTRFLVTAVYPVAVDPTTIGAGASAFQAIQDDCQVKTGVASDGTVWAIVQRAANTTSPSTPADLVLLASTDNGNTWANGAFTTSLCLVQLQLDASATAAGAGYIDSSTDTLYIAVADNAPGQTGRDTNVTYLELSYSTSNHCWYGLSATTVKSESNANENYSSSSIVVDGSRVEWIVATHRDTTGGSSHRGVHMWSCSATCTTGGNWTEQVNILGTTDTSNSTAAALVRAGSNSGTNTRVMLVFEDNAAGLEFHYHNNGSAASSWSTAFPATNTSICGSACGKYNSGGPPMFSVAGDSSGNVHVVYYVNAKCHWRAGLPAGSRGGKPQLRLRRQIRRHHRRLRSGGCHVR